MRSAFLAAVLTVPALCAGSVRAAILISDVAVNGSGPSYSVNYRLNEAAVSGSVRVAPAANPNTPSATIPLSGPQLSKGLHAVSFTPNNLPAGQYTFTVQATAARHAGYDLITPVTTIGSNATVSYGLRVGRAPGTPSYGHIFMADFQNESPSMHPVREFGADGAPLGVVSPPREHAYTSMSATVGTDGLLYVSDQDTDAIRRYRPNVTPEAPGWTLDKTFTGPMDQTVNPPRASFATRGFQVFGTGDAATVYTTDYTLFPNEVHRATLGETARPATRLFDGSHLAAGRIDQVLVSPDGNSIYVSSGATPGAGRHLNRWILGLNPATNRTEWYLDPGFGENDPVHATLVGKARGLAFNPAGDLLWVTQNGGANAPASQNFIARVTLTPLAGSVVRVREALSILSGGAKAGTGRVTALDTNGDARLTLADAVGILASPSVVGSVVERVPMPPGAAQPVLLDTDPRGNLVVGATSDPAADGGRANVFFIMAPPDNGSADTSAITRTLGN